jgi:hypothetical protein
MYMCVCVMIIYDNCDYGSNYDSSIINIINKQLKQIYG